MFSASYALQSNTASTAWIATSIMLSSGSFVVSLDDIQRTFMYHGAEHRTINCYERGLPLTVENVQSCSTKHNRCGTTFLFFVVVIAILLYALLNWNAAIAHSAILSSGSAVDSFCNASPGARIAFVNLLSGNIASPRNTSYDTPAIKGSKHNRTSSEKKM